VLPVNANALRIPLADKSVHTVVTSPPYYGLRSYSGTASWVGGDVNCEHVADASKTKKFGNDEFNTNRPSRETTKTAGYYFDGVCGLCGAIKHDEQLGLEPTLQEYIDNTVAWAHEVKRVLRDDGTFWLNCGDSYNGSGGAGGDYNEGGLKEGQPKYPGRMDAKLKPKDLMGVPWRVAFALQEDGWWLRDAIIWAKGEVSEQNENEGSVMPGSQGDRCTSAYEFVFLFTKAKSYYFDIDAERTTSGATMRNVWRINTESYPGAHFATYPRKLAERCIKFSTSEHGVCSECGAPWARVVEKHMPPTRETVSAGPVGDHGLLGNKRFDEPIVHETKGWKPTCECNADVKPAVVYDPFLGSGTTAMVANQLGRYGVGTDLSFEYLKLAKERLGMTAMDEWMNGKKAEAALDGLPMFDG